MSRSRDHEEGECERKEASRKRYMGEEERPARAGQAARWRGRGTGFERGRVDGRAGSRARAQAGLSPGPRPPGQRPVQSLADARGPGPVMRASRQAALTTRHRSREPWS